MPHSLLLSTPTCPTRSTTSHRLPSDSSSPDLHLYKAEGNWGGLGETDRNGKRERVLRMYGPDVGVREEGRSKINPSPSPLEPSSDLPPSTSPLRTRTEEGTSQWSGQARGTGRYRGCVLRRTKSLTTKVSRKVRSPTFVTCVEFFTKEKFGRSLIGDQGRPRTRRPKSDQVWDRILVTSQYLPTTHPLPRQSKHKICRATPTRTP